MLSSIRVYDYNEGNFVDFVQNPSPGEAGYSIDGEVQGLGPVDHTINYSTYAMVPGGQYHSSTSGARNIVIEAGFNPDFADGKTVQDLRREIYRAFMPGTEVRVRLYNDGNYESRIDGWCESIKPVIFAEEPTVQISILCVDDINFRAPSETVIGGLADNEQSFIYDGDTAYGLTLDVRTSLDLSWIEIQDMSAPLGERPTATIRTSIPANRLLRIVTTPGKKQVSLRTLGGSFIDRLIGTVETSNGWPQMRPGQNNIRVRGSKSGGLTWDVIMNIRYGGF